MQKKKIKVYTNINIFKTIKFIILIVCTKLFYLVKKSYIRYLKIRVHVYIFKYFFI